MISRNEAIVDLGVVGVCSALYIGVSSFSLPIIPVIIVIVVILIAYDRLLLRRRDETPRDLGFRCDNWQRAARWILLPALGLVVVIVFRAMVLGYVFPAALWLLLPLYPLWGLIQQFVFQGIVLRRLLILIDSHWIAIVITAIWFSLVHLPDWRVCLLTLTAGLYWSWVFLKCPNIWALGLSHGILAALTYPLVLGENPVERFFQ
ncbi:MAG: CPBP family intramembrane glutamic endopeptidase [Pirellulaceae bacterium]